MQNKIILFDKEMVALSILNHLLIEVDGSDHIFVHLAADLRHQALIAHKGMEANPAITDIELVTAVTGIWGRQSWLPYLSCHHKSSISLLFLRDIHWHRIGYV